MKFILIVLLCFTCLSCYSSKAQIATMNKEVDTSATEDSTEVKAIYKGSMCHSDDTPNWENDLMHFYFDQYHKNFKGYMTEELAEEQIVTLNKLLKNKSNIYLVQTPAKENGYRLIPVDKYVSSNIKVVSFTGKVVWEGFIDKRISIDFLSYNDGNYLIQCIGKLLKFTK